MEYIYILKRHYKDREEYVTQGNDGKKYVKNLKSP